MKKLICLMILLIGFSGCGSIRGFIREDIPALAESHNKNAIALEEASKNLEKRWEFYAGVLEGLEPYLTGETMQLIDEIDAIYKSGEWTSRIAGKTLTLRVRLMKELGQQLVNDVLPGLIELL